MRDDEIVLVTEKSRGYYPKRLRYIRAIVERDGKEVEMTFMSNNFAWSARTIVDLYKHRWAIEAFFKQLKQTLQLGSFLGHNKNAIQWQVWMALLVYILLRFLAHISTWQHSFSRLAGLIRSSLWSCIDNMRHAGILWDSRGRLQAALFMRTNVFARFYLTLALPTPHAMGQQTANILAYRAARDKIWREDFWDRAK